jgi:transposase InsO family protein
MRSFRVTAAQSARDADRPVAVIRQYKVGYENSLAETINGLYKAEIIHRSGPRKTKQAVELATLEWVSWFNHHRLMGPLGNVPPAELKANHHQQREVRQ